MSQTYSTNKHKTKAKPKPPSLRCECVYCHLRYARNQMARITQPAMCVRCYQEIDNVDPQVYEDDWTDNRYSPGVVIFDDPAPDWSVLRAVEQDIEFEEQSEWRLLWRSKSRLKSPPHPNAPTPS